ncbi:hypothetical protein AB3X52_17005 [Nocardioides sp. DS6]|uniref:Uncharacterized protein n=1 Tax=Nocardioides eburneus TaxID=3231482 RepID=A0ABV3T285_9ACTN
MRTQERTTTATGRASRAGRIPPLLLWFGVAGGPAAWAVHLGTAWSVSELACLAPSSSGVLLHGGSLGDGARLTVWLGTLVPWLVALGAVGACALVTRRRRRLRERSEGDGLATERVSLLLVLGWFLSLMSLAAITGGGIALTVLEACA